MNARRNNGHQSPTTVVGLTLLVALVGCGGGQSVERAVAPAPRDVSPAYRGLKPLPDADARDETLRLCKREGLTEAEIVSLETPAADPVYFIATVEAGRDGQRQQAKVWIHKFTRKGDKVIRPDDSHIPPQARTPADAATVGDVRKNSSALVQ